MKPHARALLQLIGRIAMIVMRSRSASSFIFCWNKTAFYFQHSSPQKQIEFTFLYNFVLNAVGLSVTFYFDEKFIDFLTWMRWKWTSRPSESSCIRKLKHLQLNFQILIPFSANPSRPTSHPFDAVYSNLSWKSACRQNEWGKRAVGSNLGFSEHSTKLVSRLPGSYLTEQPQARRHEMGQTQRERANKSPILSVEAAVPKYKRVKLKEKGTDLYVLPAVMFLQS